MICNPYLIKRFGFAGVCLRNTPLIRALAILSGGRNCSPASDLVLRKLVFPMALFSKGVFFSQTPVSLLSSSLPPALSLLLSLLPLFLHFPLLSFVAPLSLVSLVSPVKNVKRHLLGLFSRPLGKEP